MTTLMEQEKQRMSERPAQLDAEREKLAANSMSWKSPNVFWHDSGKGGYDRAATESTLGKNYSGDRWGARRSTQ
jgi:hypothetical protein